MQYLFVSDAHGDRDILMTLFAKYHNQVTQIFYNGDSELPANDRVFNDVLTVAGNMDFDASYPLDNCYQEENIIFQTHGHRYDVNFSLTELLRKAKQVNAQIATFGHTHQLGVEVIDGILCLNPGSISQPRGKYAYLGGTYAIVTVTKQNYRVQYYDRQQNLLPELDFTFTIK